MKEHCPYRTPHGCREAKDGVPNFGEGEDAAGARQAACLCSQGTSRSASAQVPSFPVLLLLLLSFPFL